MSKSEITITVDISENANKIMKRQLTENELKILQKDIEEFVYTIIMEEEGGQTFATTEINKIMIIWSKVEKRLERQMTDEEVNVLMELDTFWDTIRKIKDSYDDSEFVMEITQIIDDMNIINE